MPKYQTGKGVLHRAKHMPQGPTAEILRPELVVGLRMTILSVADLEKMHGKQG
jgi:hypothetical protein